jgi:hypothetical protein
MPYKRFVFARRGRNTPKFERLYHRASLFNKLLVRFSSFDFTMDLGDDELKHLRWEEHPGRILLRGIAAHARSKEVFYLREGATEVQGHRPESDSLSRNAGRAAGRMPSKIA